MRELFQMDRQDYNPEGKVYERPSARAIILKDGKVLLNHIAKYDCYEFPGGGIEAGKRLSRLCSVKWRRRQAGLWFRTPSGNSAS